MAPFWARHCSCASVAMVTLTGIIVLSLSTLAAVDAREIGRQKGTTFPHSLFSGSRKESIKDSHRRLLEDSASMENGGGGDGDGGGSSSSGSESSSESSQTSDAPSDNESGQGSLTLTIFSAPYPFSSSPSSSDPQLSALRSWLALDPPPRVVLLGNHPSFDRVAQGFPEAQISVEPHIDPSSRGVPLVHSMLARAQVAGTEWAMIISPETVLAQNIYMAVRKTISHFGGDSNKDVFLVASTYTLAEQPTAEGMEGDRSDSALLKLREKVIGQGSRQEKAEIFLWNHPDRPLHKSVTPPFIYGRDGIDEWLVNVVVTAGVREVVEMTEAAVAYKLTNHEAASGQGNEGDPNGGLKLGQLRIWNQPEVATWEVQLNEHLLAQALGNCSGNSETGPVTMPWEFQSCNGAQDGDVCVVKGKAILCGASGEGWHTKKRPLSLLPRAKPRHDKEMEESRKANPSRHLIDSPDELLPQVADESKVVILVAVTHPYFDMLMSFVCQLRHLGIPSPLVAAMDLELYDLTYELGLPVYFEHGGGMLDRLKDRSDCDFLTECFSRATKVKPRAVLRILKLGYTVLWTDADIWWFKDPRPGFMASEPGTFLIQSEEINETLPANSRINSGLYYARPEWSTIDAFEKIVAATESDWLSSEQPTFDEQLCGKDKELRRGETECVHPNGLRTVFLDRSTHPNGFFKGLWFWGNATYACEVTGCETIHNNWLKGLTSKIKRFKDNHLWRYNEKEKLCIHDWSPKEVRA